jgi:hypothetical protein
MRMLRRSAVLALVLGLVLTRLLGLHLHACAAAGPAHLHEAPHLADNGFLFGEFHAGDHPGHQEIDPPALIAASKAPNTDADEIVIPATDRRTVPQPPAAVAHGSLHPVPRPHSRYPLQFSPPLRGPPPLSLA